MDHVPSVVTGAEHLDPRDRGRLDEAVEAWEQARRTGRTGAALRAGEDLEDLLGELELHESARRLGQHLRPLYDAQRKAELVARLAPDLGSADPEARARGLWTLGAELHRVFGDLPGAVTAYREAVATGGRGWATVAAAMNLAQLLEDAGDLDGASEAYELVVRLGPGLEEPLHTAHLVSVDRLRTLGRRRPSDDERP